MQPPNKRILTNPLMIPPAIKIPPQITAAKTPGKNVLLKFSSKKKKKNVNSYSIILNSFLKGLKHCLNMQQNLGLSTYSIYSLNLGLIFATSFSLTHF